MQRIYLTLLIPAAAVLSLPSCEAVPEAENLTFRVDTCVLVNEPPRPPEEGVSGEVPPDLQLYPPCYDPDGCTNPANGYFYYTYFDDAGGYTNVSGDCPPEQEDPKVEASSLAAAVEECQLLYGEYCRALCDCHGLEPVLEAGEAQSCAEPTGSNIYACGCSCELPPV